VIDLLLEFMYPLGRVRAYHSPMGDSCERIVPPFKQTDRSHISLRYNHALLLAGVWPYFPYPNRKPCATRGACAARSTVFRPTLTALAAMFAERPCPLWTLVSIVTRVVSC